MQEIILKRIEEVTFKKVNADEHLISSGLLDSITLVEFAVSLEEEFNIKIPFTDVNSQNFETATSIEKLVASLKNK